MISNRVTFLSFFIAISCISCSLIPVDTEQISSPSPDPRNIRSGHIIPDQGYCDQPYVVITKDGNWLCTLTTGRGDEGQPGQHVVATISEDKGRTWSELIDIEPETGPEASWVVPLVVPSGRVYAFYDYNGDRITGRRADMLGWYVFKYSDDNGRTWSEKRYRLPVRKTACDMDNGLEGDVQIFWGIDKPMIHDGVVYFAFTKLGKYMLDLGEGWLFRSDNIITEKNAEKIRWEMLPEGEHGLRAPEFGSIQEEHNLVALSDGTLFCMYRTTTGHPCHCYSTDRGRTWTKPEYATYTPGGRQFKHNRACPAVWKLRNEKFLFWFNHHGGKTFEKRNPVWISGGIEKRGKIHWSQPEILLYDPDESVRISYPDLIEDNGRYWITETQKSVARVHEIDPNLLDGLWSQGIRKTVARKGLVLSLNVRDIKKLNNKMLRLPNLSEGGRVSLDFWIRLDEISPGQVILDSRDENEKGILVQTAENEAVRTDLSDGTNHFTWDSDPGSLKPNSWHHVAVIVDGGPKILTYVIDGIVGDGGESRERGWGRFTDSLSDINGSQTLTLAPALKGQLHCLRIYSRYLRTSEAISNYHAGF
ncbi:MAG: LamG-like jellyroll fold domain-containing protein [bacterium]